MAEAGPRRRAEPFYNPAMALDRDLAVAVVGAALAPAAADRAGWETSAATGVRGLRLLTETGRFGSFRLSEAGDLLFPVLQRNCARVPGAVAVHEDARRTRPELDRCFDYVDIDPYGSPIPFVPAAARSLRTGGLLAVTATDMIVLAGAQPPSARRRYGAEPIRGRLGPEAGLRILLASLARLVRADGRRIEPLVSYVGDHHVRTYLRLRPLDTAVDPVGTVDPTSFDGPYLPTGGPFGPMWTGPVSEPAFLDALAVPATASDREAVAQLVSVLREEAHVAAPFFYEANVVASKLGLEEPPARAALLDALRTAGFAAVRTHCRPEGIRTTAPRAVVERAARAVSAQSQKARVRA